MLRGRVITRLDASLASPARGSGVCTISQKVVPGEHATRIRPEEERLTGLVWRASVQWTFDNRLEAYATITGARSSDYPIGRLFSISSPEDRVFAP